MPLTDKVKGIIAKYRRAAGLSDYEYRTSLKTLVGVTTTTDPYLTPRHADIILAWIERVLADRIEDGRVWPPPWPYNPHYWRNRIAGPGKINSRHRALINELYTKLVALTGPARVGACTRNDLEYVKSIAAKACGKPVANLADLTADQAGLLIQALRDRLTWAARESGSVSAAPRAAAPAPPSHLRPSASLCGSMSSVSSLTTDH